MYMIKKNIHKQILKKIKEYDEIVIARHIGPDPDAISSEIALRDIIRLNFPKKKVYAVGNEVSRFRYFGNLDKISSSELSNNTLMIILDVPRWDRVDYMKKEGFAYTIKIDHHPCEEQVCDLELVDDTSASTTQLITEFIYETKLKINKNIAENLFCGIVSDSDRFLLSYTTPKTLMLVSKLLEDYKFELMPLYNNLYERPLDERKFESYIINNIDITENGFGSIILDNKIFKLFNVDSATASNMVNDFNFIKELKVWAFASWDERNNIFKVNIRSRGTQMNEVAEKFNGGGHKFASGARLQSLDEVKALFKALDDVCKENK